MKNFNRTFGKLIVVSLFLLAITACNNEPAVSFSQSVKPILDAHCLDCHQPGGQGLAASGLDMTSYDNLMKGTRFGPMVIGGDVEGSNLLVLIEGRADPSISMPHGQNKIVKEDIETIRLWIGQGAKNN